MFSFTWQADTDFHSLWWSRLRLVCTTFHGDNNELGTACGRYYRPVLAPYYSGYSGSEIK